MNSELRVAEKKDWLKGASGDWEIIIGMEVHAQVTSKSKLFSGASAEYGGEPNAHVSLIDAGMPGMLPVINRYCVEQAIRTGLGLNAQINLRSRFDRKNYFYPDLPQGYQISQYKEPIVGEGAVDVEADGEPIVVRIERLMERSAAEAGGEGDALEAGKVLLRHMQRFASGLACRHRTLSEYFGQAYPRDNFDRVLLDFTWRTLRREPLTLVNGIFL